MKKMSITIISLLVTFTAYSQNIILPSVGTGIVKSNDCFTGFEVTFSCDKIESVTITGTERGTFSAIDIRGAYPSNEYGVPQLPVFKKMIAIPVGTLPKVVVKNYTTGEYDLENYGIHTIFPAQPDVRKDEEPSEIPFVFDEKAYSSNEYSRSSVAEVEILGIMRGVVIGMVTVYPVRYNPVSHSLMVYNDIDIEVVFENADYRRTEELFVKTFSPYFVNTYKTLFNSGVHRGVYEDHPDLYSTPVYMLVIADRMFEETLQPWFDWKTQKGFFLDINYTDEVGTTAVAIKTFCHDKYHQGVIGGTAPTFIVFVGDTPQVPASQTGSQTGKATDLYYATVDGDYFPEMYYSRLSAQTPKQLENQIEKILYYEQYQFADPAYLDNVLLIAGVDDYWNPKVAQPTINYATNYYFNSEHGYFGVHKYLTKPYTGCYSHLNNIGFANYTAHCDETCWGAPIFTRSQISTLSNTNKYFVAMGNCCLAADFGYGECFGEAMMRAEKKGAVGYIGSSPNSYWGGDFHFAVGAYAGSLENPIPNPTLENTTTGCYDFMFQDTGFNTLCSHVFGGNLAVTYAYSAGYPTHVSAHYYWEAYNVLGDGSLMPYNAQGNENTVSHLPVLPIGEETFEVIAAPGSYVAISKNSVLHGVSVADETGIALVSLNPPVNSEGDVDVVVTRNQYIPHLVQIPAVVIDGPYIVFDSYTLVNEEVLTYISENSEVAVTLKNIGTEPSEGALTITISCDDTQLTINKGTAQCESIGVGEKATVSFNIAISNDIPDDKIFTVNINIADEGKTTWTGKMTLKAYAPIFSLEKVLVNDIESDKMKPGVVVMLTAVVANKGHAEAYNVKGEIETGDEYLNIGCKEPPKREVQNLPAGESLEFSFAVITDFNTPPNHEILMDFLLTAQYGLSYKTPVTAICSNDGDYCIPKKTNCHQYNDRITSFQLIKTSNQSVLIDHQDPECSDGGYTDYTDVEATFNPEHQYTVKIKNGTQNQRVKGWIDLNGDNFFDDNETVFSIACAIAEEEYSETFTISENAVPGTHRFRIRTQNLFVIPDACSGYNRGQTLDYSAIIPEIYPRVQNVTAKLDGKDNIIVSWDVPNGETPLGYNIYRRGICLNPAPLTQQSFTEKELPEGSYAYVYKVTAVYQDHKESVPEMSNVICINGNVIVGIDEIEDPNIIGTDSFVIFPNPTTGELRVVTSNQLQVAGVEIFDLMGRKRESAKARKYEGMKDNSPPLFPSFGGAGVVDRWQAKPDGVVIDVSHLPQGLYFVRITTEDSVVVRKVVKR